MTVGDAIRADPAGGAPSKTCRLPRVSVVLPTYNRAHMLQQAVASVTAQTVTDWELIVVDDASTDATPEVARSLEDEKIRYIRHASNQGGSAARNTGIRAARGAYVAFLDDDDIWLEGKLEAQLERIEGYDACLCACYVNDRSRIKRRPIREVKTADLLRGNPFAGSGLLVESSIMKRLLFDEALPKGQDWDVLMRLAARHTIAYVNDPLFVFNDGDHIRITTSARGLSVTEIEQRLAAARKHRQALGPFWFNYRQATELLAHLRERPAKLEHVAYVTRRCGLAPTAMVFLYKVRRTLQGAAASRLRSGR